MKSKEPKKEELKSQIAVLESKLKGFEAREMSLKEDLGEALGINQTQSNPLSAWDKNKIASWVDIFAEIGALKQISRLFHERNRLEMSLMEATLKNLMNENSNLNQPQE